MKQTIIQLIQYTEEIWDADVKCDWDETHVITAGDSHVSASFVQNNTFIVVAEMCWGCFDANFTGR